MCGAPTIQHFSESVSGLMTIRSYGQEPRFVSTSFCLMNDYSRPNFHNAGVMEWLGLHLDMLLSLTFAFSLVFLISVPKGIIDPGSCFKEIHFLLFGCCLVEEKEHEV